MGTFSCPSNISVQVWWKSSHLFRQAIFQHSNTQYDLQNGVSDQNLISSCLYPNNVFMQGW